MGKEYTQEESDSLILQEMWLAEDNSITNNEEVETELEETQEEVETDDVTDEVEETETEEQETEEVASKPKKWIAKVLHQRNEARREAEEAKTQAQLLQAKLDELEANGNYGNEEYVQTLVDKRIAEKEEISDFFADNTELKQYKSEIINYSKDFWLDIKKATKLFLAENAPELLLDKETRNKQQSKIYWVPAVTSKKLSKWGYSYSDNEFEEMAKKGLIKF